MVEYSNIFASKLDHKNVVEYRVHAIPTFIQLGCRAATIKAIQPVEHYKSHTAKTCPRVHKPPCTAISLPRCTARDHGGDAREDRVDKPEVQRVRRRQPQLREVSGKVSAVQEFLLCRLYQGSFQHMNLHVWWGKQNIVHKHLRIVRQSKAEKLEVISISRKRWTRPKFTYMYFTDMFTTKNLG